MLTLFFFWSSFSANRAIYFAAYSTAKEKLNGVLEPDSTQVHMVSAGMAGNYMCLQKKRFLKVKVKLVA